MRNIFKTERPIIALILGAFLLLKVISGAGLFFNTHGIVSAIIGAEIVFILFVIYGMNKRGGGEASIKTLIMFTVSVIFLDFAAIFVVLNGSALRSEYIARIVGGELTYVLTVIYLAFSKKMKRFKSFQ